MSDSKRNWKIISVAILAAGTLDALDIVDIDGTYNINYIQAVTIDSEGSKIKKQKCQGFEKMCVAKH